MSSLIPGLSVKLSAIVLARPTVPVEDVPSASWRKHTDDRVYYGVRGGSFVAQISLLFDPGLTGASDGAPSVCVH